VNKYLVLFVLLYISASVSAQSFDPNKQRRTKEGGLPVYTEDRPALTPRLKPGLSPNGLPIEGMSSINAGPQAEPDTPIHIGLLLPFEYTSTSGKIYGYMKDKELAKSDIYKVKETSREALDFYEGLQYALNHTQSRQKIEFQIYDTDNSDSVVMELLKQPSLKKCQVIIGPSSPAEAKLVAAFCKKYQIINIQPFVASKSIASENPWLVRLMPTIDAHLQKEYEMVMDSFADKNIIVYTTKRDRDLSAAKQLDTLFKAYNGINKTKLRYTLVNTGDSTKPAAKRTLATYLLPKELNVVLMTCYDEPLVNSMLRTAKENTVIFGMPTWMDGDQIRLDYMSKAQPYYTDNFYPDTLTRAGNDFIANFSETYSQKPSRHAYMGYDAMNYLTRIFDKYGTAISEGINKESFDGLGYSFHISPVLRTVHSGSEMSTNYYANTAMHVFQVRDYRVWLVR
jgi:ABC-type branched-subunit amino acid transport system substrate-binding protein